MHRSVKRDRGTSTGAKAVCFGRFMGGTNAGEVCVHDDFMVTTAVRRRQRLTGGDLSFGKVTSVGWLRTGVPLNQG